MSPTVRNIIAVVAGLLIGGLVNFGLIMASAYIISPPEGVDMTDGRSIAANIERFKWFHYIFPFLAHALGTLVGAFVASRIAATRKLLFALLIGLLFLIGGLINAYWIPAPKGFIIMDLIIAYIPMAYLGHRLFRGKKQK